jgi:hypothetical protein
MFHRQMESGFPITKRGHACWGDACADPTAVRGPRLIGRVRWKRPAGMPWTEHSVCGNTVQASRGRQSTGRAEVGERSIRLDCEHPDRTFGCVERKEKLAVGAYRDVEVRRTRRIHGENGPR